MEKCEARFVLISTKGGTIIVKKCDQFDRCVAPDAKRMANSSLFRPEDDEEIKCPDGHDIVSWETG